jgi:ParB family chromosome partitioning protein
MPTTLEDLPLSRVLPHGKNPRLELRDIPELAASIKAQGVMEPLIVAPLNGTQYTIIAGHRRHAAAKEAGLLSVPCWIRDDLDTPDKQLAAMLVENTQRHDLTLLEEADAYAQLVAFPGWTQAKVAREIGRDEKTVASRVKIAKLPEKARAKVAAGQATLADAAALAEYSGSKADFKRLEAAFGTNNFRYELEAVRRDKVRGAVATAVRKHAKDHGWTIATSGGGLGRNVLDSAHAKARSVDSVRKALADLDDTHVLWDSRGYWSVHAPKDATLDDGARPESEWARQRREERERLDILEAARPGRVEHYQPLLTTFHRNDDLRVEVLRVLVLDLVDHHIGFNDSWRADRAAELGLPTAVDQDNGKTRTGTYPAMRAWADNANEGTLWKTLLNVALGIGGDDLSEDEHVAEIRLAEALGYEPADVETAALARAEEATS